MKIKFARVLKSNEVLTQLNFDMLALNECLKR